MQQVSDGISPDPPSAAEGLVYVALQELATRIAHRNTGKLLEDRVGYDVMARVASDENLHFLFYRDLVKAAIDVDPSGLVIGIEHQVREFEMPGVGIANFSDHAAAIAKAGIYDLLLHHEQILVPVVLRYWDVEAIEGLTPEAEKARDALVTRIDRIGRAARRLAERRDRAPIPV
jgi:acyl-[acyl-carrier-protein] desaturase